MITNIERAGIVHEHDKVSEEVIKEAFTATDDEFTRIVRKQWKQKPHIASQGTCCLVGIICNGKLYIANAGDSRVVMGRLDKMSSSRGLRAMQLSTDHNAKMETEREELRSLHPHDPDIVVQKHKAWRVKGIIQVHFSFIYLVLLEIFSIFSYIFCIVKKINGTK